jgi:TonB family protein
VWSHTLSGKGSRIFTLYNSGGAPISSRYSLEIKRYGSNDEGIDPVSLWAYHASALRSGMEDAKRSLATFLAEGSGDPPALQAMPDIPAHLSAPESDPRERPGLSPLSREQPRYPNQAAEQGIQGWVALEFTVSGAGRVEEPVVVASGPPGYFEEAALAAIASWTYSPEVRDGQPIASSGVRVILRFRLD